MNSSKYKSVSMRKNAWDITTALADKMIPYGKMSRSQIVEIAINRLNHQVFKGEVSLNTYSKPKKLHLVKVKLPDPAYVGTAITTEEIEARNRTIYKHRVIDNDLTLQQLGTMYNLSRERVRQIQEREVSNKKLKHTPTGDGTWEAEATNGKPVWRKVKDSKHANSN